MEKKSNKRVGNEFEESFCEKLFSNGYYCHRLNQNHTGQPADVIACKNGKAYLIDCKDCKSEKFELSRIELNQRTSMKLFKKCGNGCGLFALRVKGAIYMISATKLFMFEKEDVKALTFEAIKKEAQLLDKWLFDNDINYDNQCE